MNPDPIGAQVLKGRGWTKVPNSFFDQWMSKLKPSEVLVYLFVVRKTWGFSKYHDQISTSQFIEATGLSRREVLYCTARLKEVGLLIIKGKPRHILSYEPTARSFSDWIKNGNLVQDMHHGGSDPCTTVVQDMHPTKERKKLHAVKR